MSRHSTYDGDMDARHPLILDPRRSALVVVDMQERLLPSIPDAGALVATVVRWIEAARLLGVPVFATEQYRKGLGPTHAAIAAALTDAVVPFDKTSFSVMGCGPFVAALRASEKTDVVLVGIETHVCVAQSAIDLLSVGYGVHLGLDAVGAGTAVGDRAGKARMAAAGVVSTCFEACVFDWMGDAAHPAFKTVQESVKAARRIST